jgi:lysophospholipase L1-like esterase
MQFLHEQPARVLIIAIGALTALVIGCAYVLLHVSAIPQSSSRIRSSFIVSQDHAARSTDERATPPVAAMPVGGAPAQQNERAPEAAGEGGAQLATIGQEEGSSLDFVPAAYVPSNRRRPAIRILQLGDSHTAADFFSGELRQRLQARFGIGGPGYLAAGAPRFGVRTGLFKVTASSGWTYQALQKSDNTSQFWLSGFNTVSAATGNSITYSSDRLVTFDSIELDGIRQPQGGSIEIRLDGVLASTFDFNGPKIEPMVFRIRPQKKAIEQFRTLEIKTTSGGTVVLSSVAIYDSQSGVSLSSIGYPGATVGILNKFAPDLLSDDLRRIDPQIVILAFGTNEASNDMLRSEAYTSAYEQVLDKIKAALPSADIVIVGPPDGEERDNRCKGAPAEMDCRSVTPSSPAKIEAGQASHAGPACHWHQLVKLTEVRNAENEIATRRGLAYWNWASIMPQECGAHRWVTANPPLMTPDHIHFTRGGYAMSADRFLPTLMPLVEKYVIGTSAASSR